MKKFLLAMALVCAAYVSAETTSNVSDLLNPLITGVPSLSIGPDAVAGGMGDLIYTGTPAGVGRVEIGDHLEGFVEGTKLLDCQIK